MSGDAPARPDDPLFVLYRRYLGEPESETDVYVGFALFFGGLALAALGFLVFLWNSTVPRDATLFVQLREIAIALVVVGLPGFALSVAVLLPIRRAVLYAGVAGALLCLAGAAVFVATYPAHWNVPGRVDYSVQGITVYAAGVALLSASTGSALVTYRLERVRARAASEGGGGGDPADATGGVAPGGVGSEGSAGGTDPSVSEERVRRDIEEAMESAELTWGGVEKSETRSLRIDAGDAEEGVDHSGFDPDSAQTARSAGVDDAVAGLRKLQGGEPETGTAEGVDEQTAALAELRERQEREAEREPDSAVGRLRERLGL